MSCDVARWDSLLEHPEYQQQLDFLHSLYINKEERKKLNKQSEDDKIKLEFSSAIDKTIGKRLSKIKAAMNSNIFDQERTADLCKQYIMEDLAGRLLLAKYYKCDFEAYPNDRNAAATVIQKYFIKKDLRWLKIKFGDLKQRIKKIKDKFLKEKTTDNKDDLSQLKNQLLLLKADTKKQNREGQQEINKIREEANKIREQARQEIKKIQYRENKLNNAIDEAEEELLRAEGNGGKQAQVDKCKEKIKEIQKELAIIGAEKKELQILRGGRRSPKLSVSDNHNTFFPAEDTSFPIQPTAPTSSNSSLSSEDSSSDIASLSSSPNEEGISPLQTTPNHNS